MRILFIALLLHVGFAAMAQDRCATSDYSEAQKMANPFEAKKITDAEAFIQKRTSSQYRTIGPAILKIPVVVHILYKEAAHNISDAQVKSQMEALNRDFRRKNADTSNTPERFRSIAADVQIEFYLATADPKGRTTSGIIRKHTNVSNWIANDKIKFSAQGGDDAWDSKSYLNIWVGTMAGGAGYSSAPGCDPAKDGVVINTTAFGTINVSGNYNGGRTATHEIGHWLGLKHIWGDTQCGDDLVGDTPSQGTYTSGCPSGFRSTCSNGSLGDMYMNYMDYTSDACMNLFTEGQKRRMLSLFGEGGPREAMLQSKGLKEPWLEESALLGNGMGMALYPNPANDEINIALSSELIGQTITINNANGSLVQNIPVRSINQKVSLVSLKPGLYFVRTGTITEKFIKL